MHHFFQILHFKNLEILVSLSNNFSSLFLNSSFNLPILFIFSFVNNPNSLSHSKFLKISYLSIKVVKSSSKFSEIFLISSSSIFNFLSVSFFILFISCSVNNSTFLSHLICLLNFLVHP